MTTIAPGSPAAPEPTTRTNAAQPDWIRPRTTPDGDIMPGEDTASENSELGFGDLLDVINPLQHLPVVGTIYRALTGDTISDAARMAGGALFGGPFGLIGALANVVVEHESGQDIGDTAMAWLTDGPEAGGEAGSALADAGGVSATQAQPINAAPVTIAAANASPAALAATASPAAQAANASPAAQAANASPAALAATASPAALAATASRAAMAATADRAARADNLENPDGGTRGTTDFQGRNADRLDAFIQQASAVRRRNPLALSYRPGPPATNGIGKMDTTRGGSIDPARLQAATLTPPTVVSHSDKLLDKTGRDAGLALAGGDAGSVNDWMLRALDKYEHMQRQERS